MLYYNKSILPKKHKCFSVLPDKRQHLIELSKERRKKQGKKRMLPPHKLQENKESGTKSKLMNHHLKQTLALFMQHLNRPPLQPLLLN